MWSDSVEWPCGVTVPLTAIVSKYRHISTDIYTSFAIYVLTPAAPGTLGFEIIKAMETAAVRKSAFSGITRTSYRETK